MIGLFLFLFLFSVHIHISQINQSLLTYHHKVLSCAWRHSKFGLYINFFCSIDLVCRPINEFHDIRLAYDLQPIARLEPHFIVAFIILSLAIYWQLFIAHIKYLPWLMAPQPAKGLLILTKCPIAGQLICQWMNISTSIWYIYVCIYTY